MLGKVHFYCFLFIYREQTHIAIYRIRIERKSIFIEYCKLTTGNTYFSSFFMYLQEETDFCLLFYVFIREKISLLYFMDLSEKLLFYWISDFYGKSSSITHLAFTTKGLCSSDVIYLQMRNAFLLHFYCLQRKLVITINLIFDIYKKSSYDIFV